MSELCSLELPSGHSQQVGTASILTFIAVKTTRPKHVDTTLCPGDELMWLRTTLVFRDGIGWEVDEYCESVSDLQHNMQKDFVYLEQAGAILQDAGQDCVELALFNADKI